MHLPKSLVISIFILISSQTHAVVCRESPVDITTGDFKIIEIQKAQAQCSFDEDGKFLDKDALYIEQPGCVIKLELVKSSKNSSMTSSQYFIYDEGSLCSKKIGERAKLKLQSISNECCIEISRARNGKFEYCQLKPVPKTVESMTPKLLMCSQKSVEWRVIK